VPEAMTALTSTLAVRVCFVAPSRFLLRPALPTRVYPLPVGRNLSLVHSCVG
jgi:hypothetical protein